MSTTISPPVVGQHVASQAFDRRAELLAANRELARENRKPVVAFLEAYVLSWSDPDCGVKAFLSVPDGLADSESFYRALVDAESVVLAPGSAFGHRTASGSGSERIERR